MDSNAPGLIGRVPFPINASNFGERQDRANIKLQLLMARVRMAARSVYKDIWDGLPYWYNITAEVEAALSFIGFCHIQGFVMEIPYIFDFLARALYEPSDDTDVSNIPGLVDREYSEQDDIAILATTTDYFYWWNLRGNDILQSIPSYVDIVEHMAAYERVVRGNTMFRGWATETNDTAEVKVPQPSRLVPDDCTADPKWQAAFGKRKIMLPSGRPTIRRPNIPGRSGSVAQPGQTGITFQPSGSPEKTANVESEDTSESEKSGQSRSPELSVTPEPSVGPGPTGESGSKAGLCSYCAQWKSMADATTRELKHIAAHFAATGQAMNLAMQRSTHVIAQYEAISKHITATGLPQRLHEQTPQQNPFDTVGGRVSTSSDSVPFRPRTPKQSKIVRIQSPGSLHQNPLRMNERPAGSSGRPTIMELGIAKDEDSDDEPPPIIEGSLETKTLQSDSSDEDAPPLMAYITDAGCIEPVETGPGSEESDDEDIPPGIVETNTPAEDTNADHETDQEMGLPERPGSSESSMPSEHSDSDDDGLDSDEDDSEDDPMVGFTQGVVDIE